MRDNTRALAIAQSGSTHFTFKASATESRTQGAENYRSYDEDNNRHNRDSKSFQPAALVEILDQKQ
jgi:hypothetical protein